MNPYQPLKRTTQTIISDPRPDPRRELKGGGVGKERVEVTEMTRDFFFVLKFFITGFLWGWENLENINI